MEDTYDVEVRMELEGLKVHLKSFQDKLSDVVSRVHRLETRLNGAPADEEAILDGAPNSTPEYTTKKSCHSSRSVPSRPKSVSDENQVKHSLNHLVSTAYFSRLVQLPKGVDLQTLQGGLSFRDENGNLMVDSVNPNQATLRKLINPGDTILSINGIAVRTEHDLITELQSTDAVTLEIVPSALQTMPFSADEVYVKCLFDYDPSADPHMEQKQDGLKFSTGDVLQINGKTDEDWWQARKVDDWACHGLIPSFKALKNWHTADLSSRSKGLSLPVILGDSPSSIQHKIMNGLTLRHRKGPRESEKLCTEGAELFYEELTRMSPYGRRVLLLIGTRGVGRRTIKSNILKYNQEDFATVIPYTSRKPKEGEREGREYHFSTHHQMKEDISQNQFLEWGELNDTLYGTKIDSVRRVIRKGQVCVIDCNPEALKLLRNKEFMPFTVFIEPPPYEEFRQIYAIHREILKPRTDEELLKICEESAFIKQMYRHQFDLTLVNRNTDVTFRRLLDTFETLKTQKQWVPSHWLG